MYFTDPTYGLANPGDQELSFNGLFRRRNDGSLTAPFMGQPGSNQPNGVGLSPDGNVLYFTDTEQGTLHALDVATAGADPGALSGLRTLASMLAIPDGLCLDRAGNVFVTTGLPGVEVFSADGARWGRIDTPRIAANCTFGDADGRTLFITAREGLYRVQVAASP